VNDVLRHHNRGAEGTRTPDPHTASVGFVVGTHGIRRDHCASWAPNWAPEAVVGISSGPTLGPAASFGASGAARTASISGQPLWLPRPPSTNQSRELCCRRSRARVRRQPGLPRPGALSPAPPPTPRSLNDPAITAAPPTRDDHRAALPTLGRKSSPARRPNRSNPADRAVPEPQKVRETEPSWCISWSACLAVRGDSMPAC
jgi:hypothetical protein